MYYNKKGNACHLISKSAYLYSHSISICNTAIAIHMVSKTYMVLVYVRNAYSPGLYGQTRVQSWSICQKSLQSWSTCKKIRTVLDYMGFCVHKIYLQFWMLKSCALVIFYKEAIHVKNELLVLLWLISHKMSSIYSNRLSVSTGSVDNHHKSYLILLTMSQKSKIILLS